MYLPKSIILQLKDGHNNTFEIQRSGSVLQRDKSYVFRTFSPEDMAIWCKLFSNVTASRSPIQQLSTANNSIVSQRINQETTPPSSSISVYENRQSSSSILDDSLQMKPKLYSPQLNID